MLVLGLINIPTWLIVVVCIIFLFYIYTARKYSIFNGTGIPSVKTVPFIGGFPLLKNGVMQAEYEATMLHGRCVGFFLGNLPTVFLTEPDLIRELFVKRFTEYPSRSQVAGVAQFWEKTILFCTDLHFWKFLRSTLSPTFTSGKLRKMEELIRSCIDRTVAKLDESLENGEEGIDMAPVFQNLTLEVICQSALGVELEVQHDSTSELRKQISELLGFSLEKNPVLTLLFIIPDLRKLYQLLDIDYNNTKAIAYIQQCLKSVIEERKKEGNNKKQDLLQLMINSNLKESAAKPDSDTGKEPDSRARAQSKTEVDGSFLEKPSRGMTDEEIIANAIMFLFAGYDTTSTALIFTSYFLATHPECQERVVKEIVATIGNQEPNYDNIQELSYLEMFVSESMRLYPPVTRINRQITTATQIGPYKFPANISVTCPVYTLHRIPEFWPEPEKFDPERFSAENKSKIQQYTYLPFGAGPRNCLGMRFANMELKMTLVKLLQKFKLSPSADLSIPPKLAPHVFCRPIGGMKLVLERRK